MRSAASLASEPSPAPNDLPGGPAPTENGGRRPQERGLATRAALVNAAVECLVEQGYAATTTIEVAKRAGVSRGAQLHHFPTRAALVAAAVGELYERRMREFADTIATIPPTGDRVSRAIDLMWSMFNGPTFVAWAEVWIAARTDPQLRAAVLAMDERCSAEAEANFDQVFASVPDMDPDLKSVALAFTFAVMDGLAFQSLLAPDHYVQPTVVLEALRAVARVFTPAYGSAVAADVPEDTP